MVTARSHLTEDDRALIVTLKLDPTSFQRLDALRRRHFPAARNHLPAHPTLFHKLDGKRLDAVAAELRRAVRRPPIALTFDGLRQLGGGVAFSVASPDLLTLRAGLAQAFADQLGAQDRQAFRPHVTVQNKVAPDEARRLHERLSAGTTTWDAAGEGLLLWRYLGGPWSLEASFDFEPHSA